MLELDIRSAILSHYSLLMLNSSGSCFDLILARIAVLEALDGYFEHH